MTQNQKKKSNAIYIRDDLGHAWYFDGEKIRLQLADLDPEFKEENGYYCAGWEDGIRILNEFGYISGYDEPSGTSPEEYFELKAHAEGWQGIKQILI